MDSHTGGTAGGGSGEPEAYYLPRGNGRYEPTRATESPWDRTAQHGGPPAALLAHVIDQTVEGPLRIGRISVDILGPIPLREAVVEVSTMKPGRRVQLTEARMIVDGQVAVTVRRPLKRCVDLGWMELPSPAVPPAPGRRTSRIPGGRSRARASNARAPR
jgi:hypothetical protein